MNNLVTTFCKWLFKHSVSWCFWVFWHGRPCSWYESVYEKRGLITASQYRENVSKISRRRLICDTVSLCKIWNQHDEVVFTAICILVFAGFYIEIAYKSKIRNSVKWLEFQKNYQLVGVAIQDGVKKKPSAELCYVFIQWYYYH